MSFGVTSVSARYGDTEALRDVTWMVDEGSIGCVVGGDGAGKTTLLRALAGAQPLTTGWVSRPERDQIGFMSSSSAVYRDLTVWENLRFVGAVYRIAESEFDESAAAVLAATGLGGFRDRLAGRLSGGMRQKLALGLAMLHDPTLLVLDEPTTGVDPVSRAELWQLIAAAAASGRTVVASTTYLDEAERAESVLVLDDGTLLLTGTPDELVAGMPGSVTTETARPATRHAWRHGRTWREWHPGGSPDAMAPTLEDAVIVAELSRADTDG